MPRLALVGIAIASVLCACGPERTSGSASGSFASSPSSSSSAAAAPEAALAFAVEPVEPPAPAAPARPLRVLVGGDLLPHRPSLVTPASIRAALAPLAPTFAKADVVVANYEAATGDVDPKAFRMAYAAPNGWLEELPRAGIRALTVANNHACDLGIEGLEATLSAAARGGAIAIGGDAHDPWAARAIVEQGGKRVCAVGWTTLMNAETGCSRTIRLATAPLDRQGKQRIHAALTRAKGWCDATIAIIHGGQEYVGQIREVMDQARYAADAGADAVVVHHPHVASPVVVHATKDGRNVPVFASVGNLVSNQGESWKPSMFPVLRENRRLVCVNGWTRLGVLADLAFDFQKDGVSLDWGFHLTWTENEHASDRTVAIPKIETRVLDPERDAEIVARLSEDDRGPVDLFDDPCWAERPVLTVDEATRDPRCTTAIRRVPAGPAAALGTRPVANRPKKKR